MISWIQRYFQRHFKTIFAVLLAVTIISFIFTIGAAPGIGRGDRRYVERPFFGYNLALAEDVQRIKGDAMLSASLQYGPMAGIDDDQIQQYAFQRAATLHLADEWHVPMATTAEIKDAIPKLRMFAGPNGEFDPKAYATFRDNLKGGSRGVTEADIARIIGDDIRADKVRKLLSGPGYVLPREVKAQVERTETTWTLATATADYAAFKPEIKPTDADLNKYFTDNVERYQVPPRVVVAYADFPSTQFVSSVKVTEEEIRAYYDSNPARFPKPPEVKPADGKATAKPTTPDAEFAAVCPQVQAALILERAQKVALKAASDLAVRIFEAKVPNGPALDGVLSSWKIQTKTLAPFTRQEGPAELGHSPELAEEAFKLSGDRFVSDAVPSPTGAVVLFWKETQPAHKPLFTEVREKVAADYVENEKRKKFVELGKAVKTQLENRVKAGDTFDKAVAAAASATGLKLEVKTIAPFSARTLPQDIDYTVFGALDRLNKGEVSDMLINPDKGVFVYAQDKKTPDLKDTNPQYVEDRNLLAAQSGRIAASGYLSELVDRELKLHAPKED